MPHLRYLSYVLRHKWFVFLGGLRYRVPLHQLIVHDWSKFTPREWGPYVDQFYRGDTPKSREGYYHNPDAAKTRFNSAWLRHGLDNKHHWQHYVMFTEPGKEPVVVPMPDRFVREMLADWSGAGRAQGAGNDPLHWYMKNRDRMTLHPLTRQRVDELVGYTLVTGKDD